MTLCRDNRTASISFTSSTRIQPFPQTLKTFASLSNPYFLLSPIFADSHPNEVLFLFLILSFYSSISFITGSLLAPLMYITGTFDITGPPLLAHTNNVTGPYWLITGPSYGLTVSTFHPHLSIFLGFMGFILQIILAGRIRSGYLIISLLGGYICSAYPYIHYPPSAIRHPPSCRSQIEDKPIPPSILTGHKEGIYILRSRLVLTRENKKASQCSSPDLRRVSQKFLEYKSMNLFTASHNP